MSILSSIFSFIFSMSLLVAPTPAAAAVSGLSFGGKIITLIPCTSFAGPSEYIIIKPAPATKNIAYIWTPLTLRGIPPPGLPPLFPPVPTPDPPPYIVGQSILGIADIPYFCCLPPALPTPAGCYTGTLAWVILPGQRIQWANQSLLPSPL